MAETKPTSNQKLRYERERRGWSQQEVADKVGTTPLNVGRWERGVTMPGPHFRLKLSEVFEKSVEELGFVSESAQQSKPVEASPLPVAPSISSTREAATALWNVPYNRNLFFTGREGILAQLRNSLLSEERPIALAQPQAISGLGGIGKTQTAVEYAYRYHDNYNAVLWARADSADLLISDFLLIAVLLNLPQQNEQDQSVVVKAVLRWFDAHERWLLILDNADHLEMISEFIPKVGKGHVLLTTRAHSTGTIAERIEIEKMDPDEGTAFLLRRMKRLKGNIQLETVPEPMRSQAQAIVKVVDGLPLALDQAGAYIEDTGCSLVDYLKFFKTRRNRLLRTRGRDATGHPEPVATTWSLSFEKVERANPAAAELLRLCAFLHPDEIPESMIIEGASELGPLLHPVAEDALDWNEAIGELHRYSLVKRDPELKILNIHRLVQEVLKDAMENELQGEWAERTVRMVNRAFPEPEFPAWPTCQQYLPHAQICAELVHERGMCFSEAAHLLNRVGRYLSQRAQYKEAESFLQKALAIREQISGSEHADVASIMNDLAGLYVEMGKYAEAEALYQQARSIRERVLGQLHPDVITTIHDLALLYRQQGRFVEAEPLFEQTLAVRKEILGLEHFDVAMSYNDLALVLGDLGKYANVGMLYRQALTIWEHILGPDHPEVATCLNNIGWHYYRQGRYDLVEAPHLRALAIREKGQGANHPHVAMSLNALGLLYRDQGKLEKAEPFLERALAIREQMLGPDHPDVGQGLQNLGVLYYLQGKYDLAESLLLRSVRIREQMGLDNALVSYSLNPLAILYRDQGRHDEAEELFRRTLMIREQGFGKEGIDVSYTLVEFAILYRDQGAYDEAETLFQRALAIQEKMLDPEHPKRAFCLDGLAQLYSIQGKYAQAEALYQRALIIWEQSQGQNPSNISATLEHYADSLQKMGREAEAALLKERAKIIQNQEDKA